MASVDSVYMRNLMLFNSKNYQAAGYMQPTVYITS